MQLIHRSDLYRLIFQQALVMSKSIQPRALWITTACIVVVALLILALDHRTRVLRVFPYLLLLACSLMHLWHGGHRGRTAHSAPHHDHRRGVTLPPDHTRDGGQL